MTPLQRRLFIALPLLLLLLLPRLSEPAVRRSTVTMVPAGTVVAAGTTNSAVFGAETHRGVWFRLDVASVTGTLPMLDVKVQGCNTAGGACTDVPGASFAQKSAVGVDDLLVYPGISNVANRRVASAIPGTFRVVGMVSAGDTFTLSLLAEYVP